MGRIMNPAPKAYTLAGLKEKALAEIQAELDAIDMRLARPTQAITEALAEGSEPGEDDLAYFRDGQREKAGLREKMQAVRSAETAGEILSL
jgi:hypothetical protein